jgi:hypothetical protein
MFPSGLTAIPAGDSRHRLWLHRCFVIVFIMVTVLLIYSSRTRSSIGLTAIPEGHSPTSTVATTLFVIDLFLVTVLLTTFVTYTCVPYRAHRNSLQGTRRHRLWLQRCFNRVYYGDCIADNITHIHVCSIRVDCNSCRILADIDCGYNVFVTESITEKYCRNICYIHVCPSGLTQLSSIRTYISLWSCVWWAR